MKLIQPSASLWQPSDDWKEHVTRCARVCYASESGSLSPEAFCNSLAKKGHLSMFRHATHYFVFEVENVNPTFPQWICVALANSPYTVCVFKKIKHVGRIYFVSANHQFVIENSKIMHHLAKYEVTLSQFVAKADEQSYPTALNAIRYTVCVTTQISTTRELNRTSPNNIAEQSTRYVNFGKRGGITICTPHWFACAHWSKKLLARFGWKMAEICYNVALHLGLPAQDARGFLPLDTASRVVYTYSVYEWRRIMALRLVGSTGKPHPNAKIAAQYIHDAILPAMRIFGGDKAHLTTAAAPAGSPSGE